MAVYLGRVLVLYYSNTVPRLHCLGTGTVARGAGGLGLGFGPRGLHAELT